MISLRRYAVIAACLLLTIFYLLPRSSGPSPLDRKPSTATASTTAPVKKAAPPPIIAASGSAKGQQKLSIAKVLDLPVPKQLEYHFPYDVTSKFPAFIWQTWKYTPASAKFSEKFRPTEASWTEKHPTFVHEVITDDIALHLIRHLYSAIPEVLEAYLAMPLPILKADFFRYLILLARGGIYADIDTFALKPAQEWIPQGLDTKSIGLIIGIEADPDRPDWAEWYSRRIQFCQWTIQSKPGHPVLIDIVSKITAETLKRKREGTLKADHEGVVEFTGPAAWTDSIFKYFNDPEYFDMKSSSGNITFKNFTGMNQSKRVGDVLILPITSFSPGIGHSGAGPVEDPMAFVEHKFEGSWKPEDERIIEPQEVKDAKAKEELEKKLKAVE
ncbi:nucleotide-diphospho-sugar transferase [Pyronema omphalodes]|nr:nucleotide-diphospho-sugar transferase [Pyronema omphalodes]